MLTLFTCPKPFGDPRIAQIQWNAIGSWTRLQPLPEILLLGDEEGVAEAASRYGLRHIPQLARSESGTPLVNSIFSLAESAASHPLLCYVNADIILMDDFMRAAQDIAGRKCRFLLAGRRWDIDISGALDLASPCWQDDLRLSLASRGVLHPQTGMDYFLFPRDFWGAIPPFALGRTIWDNWLLFRARQLRAPLIDASGAVTAVHQNHDYSHVPGGKTGTWKGAEATRNKELAAGGEFTLLDADWLLTRQGLVRARTAAHRLRARDSWPLLHPAWARPYRWLRKSLSRAKRLLASWLAAIKGTR